MANNPYQTPIIPKYKNPPASAGFGGEKLIRNLCIAIALVAVLDATLNLVLLANKVGPIIRLVINLVCVYFLLGGANWARWLYGFGGFFGALMFFITFFTLDKSNISMFSIIGLWLLFAGCFNIFVCLCLLITDRANQYFGT